MRVALLCLLLAAFVPAAAAQSMDIAVSPPRLDAGELQPGDGVVEQFTVLTDADADISIALDTRTGSLRTFRRLRPDAADRFSAQDCSGCVEYLSGGGELPEQDEELSGGGQATDRWQTVKFFLDVPDDIEPGSHLLELTPQPTVPGRGAVSVASTARVQLLFTVPGEAVRSGKIIGLRAGDNVAGEQRIAGTYYNNGTVTTAADFSFTVETADGSRTVNAGGATVAPGETATFTASVDTGRVNDSFPVTASVDYGTGAATSAATLTVAAPSAPSAATGRPTAAGPSLAAVLLFLLFLAVSSIATWKGVRYATG